MSDTFLPLGTLPMARFVETTLIMAYAVAEPEYAPNRDKEVSGALKLKEVLLLRVARSIYH